MGAPVSRSDGLPAADEAADRLPTVDETVDSPERFYVANVIIGNVVPFDETDTVRSPRQ